MTNDEHVVETWWRRLGADGVVCLAVGDPPRSLFFQQNKVNVEHFIHSHEGEHLFFAPHTFDGKPLARTKACSVPCRALWADLDAVDPAKLGALEPTFAFASSPKRYAGLWLTDRVPDVGLAKRLTDHVGADSGGWCFTKLLRLPGSRNQKYKPPPLALVLWDDGPVHRVDELEQLLPPLKVKTASPHREMKGVISTPRAASASSTLTSVAICDQYGVRGNLKHELLHGQPNGEDRSRALWRFAHELHERGVPAEDARVLLMSSVWSRGRADDVENVVRKIWREEM